MNKDSLTELLNRWQHIVEDGRNSSSYSDKHRALGNLLLEIRQLKSELE